MGDEQILNKQRGSAVDGTRGWRKTHAAKRFYVISDRNKGGKRQQNPYKIAQ